MRMEEPEERTEDGGWRKEDGGSRGVDAVQGDLGDTVLNSKSVKAGWDLGFTVTQMI